MQKSQEAASGNKGSKAGRRGAVSTVSGEMGILAALKSKTDPSFSMATPSPFMGKA